MKPPALFGRKTVISTRFRSVFVAAMVSMSVAYILMLTDNVVAGQIIGDRAVAAMSLVFPMMTMIFFLSYIIADGLAMMAAYAQGQGNRQEMCCLFSLGILLSLGMGAILLAVLVLFRENILSFWEISSELMDFAFAYYSGLMWIPPVEFLNIFLYTFFVQEGEERICAIAFVTAFVVNVVLSVLLCYFIGVMGIGLATVIGTLVSCLVQLKFFLSPKCSLRFIWCWDTGKVLRGCWYSFYHSMDTLLLALLPVVLSDYIINHFGEEHIIVVSVIMNMLTLIIALYTGLVDCLQPMVCQYHAEGNLWSVRKTMAIGIESTIALSLLVSLAGMAAAPVLPRLFGVTEEAMMAEAAHSLRIFLLFTVFLGVTLMYSNYYVYIQERNYSAFLKVMLLLALPAAGMALGGSWGMEGLWFGVGGAFAAAFLINLVLTRFWGSRGNILLMDENRLARQLSYDISSVQDEVFALLRRVEADLGRFSLEEARKKRLILFLEELGMHAVDRGVFQMEFSFLLGERAEDPIIMVVRDNGTPYDIIRTVEEGVYSFREYFIESVTSRLAVRKYHSSGDENRFTLQV